MHKLMLGNALLSINYWDLTVMCYWDLFQKYVLKHHTNTTFNQSRENILTQKVCSDSQQVRTSFTSIQTYADVLSFAACQRSGLLNSDQQIHIVRICLTNVG